MLPTTTPDASTPASCSMPPTTPTTNSGSRFRWPGRSADEPPRDAVTGTDPESAHQREVGTLPKGHKAEDQQEEVQERSEMSGDEGVDRRRYADGFPAATGAGANPGRWLAPPLWDQQSRWPGVSWMTGDRLGEESHWPHALPARALRPTFATTGGVARDEVHTS